MDDIERQRIEKLERIRALGIEPHGKRYTEARPLIELAEKYAELEGQQVSAAGRISAMRSFGKAVFMDVRDRTGKAQLYLKKGMISDADFQLLE